MNCRDQNHCLNLTVYFCCKAEILWRSYGKLLDFGGSLKWPLKELQCSAHIRYFSPRGCHITLHSSTLIGQEYKKLSSLKPRAAAGEAETEDKLWNLIQNMQGMVFSAVLKVQVRLSKVLFRFWSEGFGHMVRFTEQESVQSESLAGATSFPLPYPTQNFTGVMYHCVYQ